MREEIQTTGGGDRKNIYSLGYYKKNNNNRNMGIFGEHKTPDMTYFHLGMNNMLSNIRFYSHKM